MASKSKKKKSARPRKKGFFASRGFLIVAAGCLVAVAVAAAMFAFGGEDPPKRQIRQDPVVTTEMNVTVEVVDKDFLPRDLTVPLGATITWKSTADLPHNVVEDRGDFSSPTLSGGDEWSHTFDTPGTFYYYCTLHHSMLGSVIVGTS